MLRATTFAVIVLALAACDSTSAPDQSAQPFFSFQVTGAVPGSNSGRAIVMPVDPAGFVTVNPQSGARTQFAVTPIVMPVLSGDTLLPSLFIGVLGEPRVGTYAVFSGSTQLQYYADYSILLPDFTRRRFAITSGTLTLTKVGARAIEGRFTLESRVYFDLPRDAMPGTASTGVPTSLNLSGRFVASRIVR